MAISQRTPRGMLSKGGRHGICRNIMMAGNTGGETKQSVRSSSGSVHHQLHSGCDLHPAISKPPPELLKESLSGQPPSGRLKRMALTTVFRLCNGKGGGGSSSHVYGGVRCDVRPRGETWHLGSERCHRSVVLCTCDRGCMSFLFPLRLVLFSLLPVVTRPVR